MFLTAKLLLNKYENGDYKFMSRVGAPENKMVIVNLSSDILFFNVTSLRYNNSDVVSFTTV